MTEITATSLGTTTITNVGLQSTIVASSVTVSGAGEGVAAGGTTGQVLAKASNDDYDTEWVTVSGTGTVTSVAMSVPTGFSIAGSPITTSGTLALTTSLSDGLVKVTSGAFGTASAGTDYIANITGESLGDLSDVTITSVASGEVLAWSGSAWINRTLSEAGIAAASHTHTLSDVTDAGTAAAAATGDFEAAGSISTHAALTSSVHGISTFAATILDDTTAGGVRTTIGAAKASAETKAKGLVVEDPGSSEDISLFFTTAAMTITKLAAVLVGSSTPSVTWTIRHSTDRSAAGNEVVTGGTTTTSTTTGSVVTSFNDATVPANSYVWFETTAQSGTVDSINVTIEYAEDA